MPIELERAFSSLNFPNILRVVESLDAAISYLSGGEPYGDRGALPASLGDLRQSGPSRKSDFKMLKWLKGQGPLERIPVVILSNSRQFPGFEQAFDLAPPPIWSNPWTGTVSPHAEGRRQLLEARSTDLEGCPAPFRVRSCSRGRRPSPPPPDSGDSVHAGRPHGRP